MGNFGKLDYGSVTKLKDFIGKNIDCDKFFEQIARDSADALLNETKGRTPVKSGTLRDGFVVSAVIKSSGVYKITIDNAVGYAESVEYGHRVKNGFVAGKFMLTISLEELENIMPSVLENKLKELLRNHFK
jgi:hypothetical protein